MKNFDSNVTMDKAEDKDNGEIIDIKDVSSGEQFQFVCVCHKNPIIARKGQVLAHHFAHKQGGIDNIKLYEQKLLEKGESIVHIKAKEIISKLEEINIPRIIDFQQIEKFKQEFKDLDGKIYNFNLIEISKKIKLIMLKNEIEKNFTIYKPDVFSNVKNVGNDLILDNFNLAIEVVYSHKVDREKAKKYNDNKVFSIEIDFSHLSKDALDKNFELEEEIINTINNIDKYKYIYFPLNQPSEFFINYIKLMGDKKIKEINKEIMDKREKVILWAKEDEKIKHHKNTKNDVFYKCICCNTKVELNSEKTNFKHMEINDCTIYNQSPLADLFYQQELFTKRVFNAKKDFDFYITDDDKYPFKLKEIEEKIIDKKRKKFFVYENNEINQKFSVLLKYNPKENLFSNEDYLNLSEFKKYKDIDLEEMTLNFNLGSKEILTIKRLIIDKWSEEKRIIDARKKEQQIFNEYTIFYDNNLKLIKKSDVQGECKCLFCKNQLNEFKHDSVDDCIIFNDNTKLKTEYQYIIAYENFNQYFIKIQNEEIYLKDFNKFPIIENLNKEIPTKYQEYLSASEIKLNILDFCDFPLKMKNYKLKSQNIQILCTLEEKEFEFLIDCNSQLYPNMNILKFSKENFIELVNNNQPISYLFNNIDNAKFLHIFTEQIMSLTTNKLEKTYGKDIEKYIELKNIAKEKERLRKIQEQEEKHKIEQQRLLKIEEARIQKEKELEEERLKNIEQQKQKEVELKIQKELKEKERKKEEKKLKVIEKQNKLEILKNKLGKLLNKTTDTIFSKGELDTKLKMEYYILDNILVLNNDFYDYKIVPNYSAEIAYICKIALYPGYEEIIKQTDYILVINEKELLSDQLTLDNINLISTELFKDMKKNKEKIKEVFLLTNKKMKLN